MSGMPLRLFLVVLATTVLACAGCVGSLLPADGLTPPSDTSGSSDGAAASGDDLNPALFKGRDATLPAGTGASELINLQDVTDGVLAYLNIDGRNYIYMLGERADNGDIDAVTALVILNTQSGAAYQIILDSLGWPVQLVEGNVVIDISYNRTAGTFTLTRDGTTVSGALPDNFSATLDALNNGNFDNAFNAKARKVSTGTIVGGILAPLGMVAGLIVGTYTTPIWATITIVSATAGGITAAYNAAYDATNTMPPQHVQNIMRNVNRIGTITSVASLGNNAVSLVAASSSSSRVQPVLSALNDVNSLTDSVERQVRATLCTHTNQGVTVTWVDPDMLFGEDWVTVRISAPGYGNQDVQTFLDVNEEGSWLYLTLDRNGRSSRSFRKPAGGGAAYLTVFVGTNPSFVWQF